MSAPDPRGRFMPLASGLYKETISPPPGVACAACHAPVERAWRLLWCDCPLCEPCVKGVVWSCPACLAHPEEARAEETPPPEPEKPADVSAWWWIAGLVVAAGALLVLGAATGL